MKKILLGISGSIAANLHNNIINLLKRSYEVDVVVTQSAIKICPDLFRYLKDESEWEHFLVTKEVLHIELVKRNDILLIAPATANTIGKMANGIADNLLTNVFCAWDFNKPVYIAPAMNTKMWNNPFVQYNIERLSGVSTIIEPIEKRLYCGDFGVGAMADTNNIFNRLIGS